MQLPTTAKKQDPQRGSFPANEEEAMKFSNDIMQVMYNEKIYDSTVSQLEQIKDVDKGAGIGMIASNIIGNRLADVRGQTGRKINMDFAMEGLKATIKGIAEIAKENQIFEVGRDDMRTALQTAIGTLDQAGKGRQ